ncbi:MAG TPA: hypothetical protein VGC66_17485 [Pyrinomonadaceae bacterium]|jgi:photoactive yellow protein
MQNKTSLTMLPLGLLELDADGTVLYFNPDKENSSDGSAAGVVGRNIFTDIIPIAEAREFQDRIKTFKRSPAPADSFHFTFNCNQNYLPVKVLLARIHEQSMVGSTESILVHIRRLADRIAA